MNNPEKDVRWSPRAPKWKIRKLYEQASIGIYDDELVDDVGLTLYLRCRDILIIERAHRERTVTCPRCQKDGKTNLIQRPDTLDEPFTCPECGWEMTWHDYHRTFKGQQLNPGTAWKFFEEFLASYDRARTVKQRMMAIDRVIHEFHFSMRNDPDAPTRPAAANLIEGRLKDIVPFLNELSGLDLPDSMVDTFKTWKSLYNTMPWADAWE